MGSAGPNGPDQPTLSDGAAPDTGTEATSGEFGSGGAGGYSQSNDGAPSEGYAGDTTPSSPDDPGEFGSGGTGGYSQSNDGAPLEGYNSAPDFSPEHDPASLGAALAVGGILAELGVGAIGAGAAAGATLVDKIAMGVDIAAGIGGEFFGPEGPWSHEVPAEKESGDPGRSDDPSSTQDSGGGIGK